MINNPSGVVATTMNDVATPSFTLSTDLPKHMGGNNTAPQPMKLFLAAYMGCTQATAHFVARHYRFNKKSVIRLQRMEFHNITATRDLRGSLSLPIVGQIHDDDAAKITIPSRIQQLSGTIRVFFRISTEENNARAESLQILQEQTELRCPVANMIAASGCPMDVVWEDGGALSHDSFT